MWIVFDALVLYIPKRKVAFQRNDAIFFNVKLLFNTVMGMTGLTLAQCHWAIGEFQIKEFFNLLFRCWT